jgi:hypothetical protein
MSVVCYDVLCVFIIVVSSETSTSVAAVLIPTSTKIAAEGKHHFYGCMLVARYNVRCVLILVSSETSTSVAAVLIPTSTKTDTEGKHAFRHEVHNAHNHPITCNSIP